MNVIVRLLVAALPCAVLSDPLAAETLRGRADFVDGDTLHLGQAKVRLFGIDAPELDQTCTLASGKEWACGQWAFEQVKALYQGVRLTCEVVDIDRYERLVAICASGTDEVNATLVARGIALAYRSYSTRYVAAETSARDGATGLWVGSFVAPEDYRKGALNTPAAAPDGDCVIKGNISSNGRIYHLPGQESYAKTVISTNKGERWFCSEAEARAAGWRPSGSK